MSFFSNKRATKSILTVLLVWFSIIGWSQNIGSFYGLTGVGNLMPHKSITRHLQQDISYNIELGWNLKVGNSQSNLAYNKPIVGVYGQFAYSGNRDLIGNIYAISTYGLLPISKGDTPLYFGGGYGLGYVQKPFDIVSNPQNNAIGSYVNANIILMLQKEFSILNKSHLMLRLGISHYSNGSFKTPNLGLNYVYVSMGYKIQGYIIENPLDTLSTSALNFAKWNTSISLITGARENKIPLGNRYRMIGLTFQKEYRPTFKSSWIGSIDLLNNQAIKTISGNSFQAGVHLAYFLNFDRLRGGVGLGTYLFNPSEVGRIYHKVTVDHKLSDQLNLQIQLKLHKVTADFITLGMEYTFK